MSSTIMLKKLTCLVMLCMVVETLVTPHGVQAAITACNTVVKDLGPCMSYLKAPGGPTAPPGACCAGVRTLKAAAQTTADRRMACRCMKSTASSTKGLNAGRVKKLAGQCGVRVSYVFDTKIDCNTVN